MLQSLLEQDVLRDPIDQFQRWWDEAVASEIDEVNAMTLATANAAGRPAARIVLLKDFNRDGFVFFTNYRSDKGRELEMNPHAALCIYWKELERQVRIEGTVDKISDHDNDTYFFSRPVGSRIGAWASPQSTPIEGRHVIEENVAKYQERYKEEVPRPPYWGGYIVKPVRMEFWQGRSNRLHDRILFTLQEEDWKIERLAP